TTKSRRLLSSGCCTSSGLANPFATTAKAKVAGPAGGAGSGAGMPASLPPHPPARKTSHKVHAIWVSFHGTDLPYLTVSSVRYSDFALQLRRVPRPFGLFGTNLQAMSEECLTTANSSPLPDPPSPQGVTKPALPGLGLCT